MELATMLELLGSGLVLTLQVFFTTLVGALPLGVVVALCRMSRFKPLALITRFYISVMRGTPLMLQLMALMFGPYYLFGLELGPDWKYWACSIGFIINYAAYFGEIYRSGLQSIPRGQYEAAEVLGYTRAQTFLKIILPQVLSVSRMKGSSYRAQDFIMGEGRETFQYDLSQVLGSGPYIACAFGVWAMLFLAATLAAAAIGKELGMLDGKFFNAIIILSIVTTLPIPTLVRLLIERRKLHFTEVEEKELPFSVSRPEADELL